MPYRYTSQLALFLLCLLLTFPAVAGKYDSSVASPPVALGSFTNKLNLLPHLDGKADANGILSIEQISSSDSSHKFTPIAFQNIKGNTGACWFRLTIKGQPQNSPSHPSTLVLDLGAAQPGPVQIFTPQFGLSPWPEKWNMATDKRDGVLHFPSPPPLTTVTYYIRLAGPPTLWFAPALYVEADHSSSFPFTLPALVCGAISTLLLLNLLLMAMGRGESRFWLAVYSLLVLIQLLAGPAPSPSGGLPFSSIWALLTPGLALVLLPHAGRNILRPWHRSQSADTLFRAISLVGALVAVLPLVPGLGILSRWLPLWPSLAALCIPPALICAKFHTQGAKRYALACAITASGPVLGLCMTSPEMARIGAMLPTISTTLGILLLTPLVGLPFRQAASGTEAQALPFDEAAQSDNSEIVARVSHDLQTPIQAITHATESLELSLTDENLLPHIHLIHSAALNLQLLISDMLDVKRADSGRLLLSKAPFDLQRLLIEAHSIASIQAKQKGLGISWKMSPHMPVKYRGDASRLLQILLNLLSNAVRFSKEGPITLSVSRIPESTDGGHLLFTVTDSGIGIPLQNQYDILKNFTQDPDCGLGRYGSTGLGLSLAQELVFLMGGVLCIESTPNVGTEISFSIKLPMLPADAHTIDIHTTDEEETQEVHPAPTDLAIREDHILVTDDVASNRQLVSFFLEGLPVTIVEARNGKEALHIQQTNPCGLLLIDADMPDMNGAETVTALRSQHPRLSQYEIPIIGLTSREEEISPMKQAGCTITLAKPLSRKRLEEIVTAYMQHVTCVPEDNTPEEVTDETEQSATSDSETAPQFTFRPETEPEEIQASFDNSLIPQIPDLLTTFSKAIDDATKGMHEGSPRAVEQGASSIANTAEQFGLTALERMAKCVKRASEADDIEAINDLMPELETMLRRNCKALSDVHRLQNNTGLLKDREQTSTAPQDDKTHIASTSLEVADEPALVSDTEVTIPVPSRAADMNHTKDEEETAYDNRQLDNVETVAAPERETIPNVPEQDEALFDSDNDEFTSETAIDDEAEVAERLAPVLSERLEAQPVDTEEIIELTTSHIADPQKSEKTEEPAKVFYEQPRQRLSKEQENQWTFFSEDELDQEKYLLPKTAETPEQALEELLQQSMEFDFESPEDMPDLKHPQHLSQWGRGLMPAESPLVEKQAAPEADPEDTAKTVSTDSPEKTNT